MKSELRLIISFAFTISFLSPLTAAEQFQLKISLDQKTYIPSEEIIIEARLKNVSSLTLGDVVPPRVTGGRVTYDLQRRDGNEIEPRELNRIVTSECSSRTWWSANRIKLGPGEVAAASCELSRDLSQEIGYLRLAPGVYEVCASYHLYYPNDDRYETEVILSNMVDFRVRPRSEAEENIWQKILSASTRNDYEIAMTHLRAILKENPDNPFKSFIYSRLQDLAWEKEWWEVAIEVDREWGESQISSELRDFLRFEEAHLICRHTDRLPEEAVKIVEDVTLRAAEAIRKEAAMEWEGPCNPVDWYKYHEDR